MSIRFSNYKLGAGVQTNAPANVIGDNNCRDAQDLSYDFIGGVKSVKADALVRTYSNTLWGIYPYRISNTTHLVGISGTGVYFDATQKKTIATQDRFSFVEHNSALYCASAANTLFKIASDQNVWNMGCPAPSGGCTPLTSSPDGEMNGQYRFRYTYVSQHNSVEGGIYQTEGNPSPYNINLTDTTAASFVLTNIGMNVDPSYNVVAKRLYIYGGVSPKFADYFRLYRRVNTDWVPEVNNNYDSSASIAVTQINHDGTDELTALIQDNSLPPRGAYIINHFDHFCISGNPQYNNRWYFAKVSSENIPTTNYIAEREEIMGMAEWNNSVWTPTKSKLYVKTGSSEENFFNQDTEVSDGCVAPYTLTGSPFGLLWMSYNGVVKYSGDKALEILSQDIDNIFLALPSAYYTNAVGCYFDYEYWISVTETGHTENNVTWVYNFRTNGWRKVPVGYKSFGKDDKAFKLYGSRLNLLYRINDSTTYKAWQYKTRNYDCTLVPYARAGTKFYPKLLHLDIDTNGEDVTVTPYYDEVAQTTQTVSHTGRAIVTVRMPPGNCYQCAIMFSQGASSYQTTLYNYNLEGEDYIRGK